MDSLTIDFSQPTNGTALGITSERETELQNTCERLFVEFMKDPSKTDLLEYMDAVIKETNPQTKAESFLIGGAIGAYIGSNEHLLKEV